MKLYLAIIEDRHTDVAVYVYDTPEAAIARARQEAHENATAPDDIEEEQVDGWLYYARYSVESDCVHVEETTLNHP
jgi:hypothetical protein